MGISFTCGTISPQSRPSGTEHTEQKYFVHSPNTRFLLKLQDSGHHVSVLKSLQIIHIYF